MEGVPLTGAEVEVDALGGGGFFQVGGGDLKAGGGDSGEQRGVGMSVEVGDGAVVRQDFQLSSGKEDAEEPIVFFFAGMGWVTGAASGPA